MRKILVYVDLLVMGAVVSPVKPDEEHEPE